MNKLIQTLSIAIIISSGTVQAMESDYISLTNIMKRAELPEEQLCEAAKDGDIPKVKDLIDAGVNINYGRNNNLDRLGATPLIEAAMFGHQEICQLLIMAEADLYKTDRRFGTALNAAAMFDNQATCELIVEKMLPKEGVYTFLNCLG